MDLCLFGFCKVNDSLTKKKKIKMRVRLKNTPPSQATPGQTKVWLIFRFNFHLRSIRKTKLASCCEHLVNRGQEDGEI